MPLEHVVRPLQTDTFRPTPPSGLRVPNSDTEQAIIEWGSAGDDIFTINASDHQDVPAPDHHEVSRKFDVARVKNPDDPEQHLDVEVMRNYQSINKKTGEKLNLDFAPVQPSPSVQIIRANVFRESDIVPISSTSSQDL